MKRPLILVSNDDGVQAKGLNELIHMLKPLGDVIAMAPSEPRSGAACSLTVSLPVKYGLVHNEDGLLVFKCSGTPVDCVKLASDSVLDTRPDIIISGINHGDNSAVNVHYSGTMGVALEGCMKGIPSIGFSLCNHNPDADFTPASPYVRRITEEVLQRGLPAGVCLNVNFPDTPFYKGIRICRQTKGVWKREWMKRSHPNGGDYYWLTGEFVEHDEEEDSDHWALNHDYVAITPTLIDMTAYGMMEEMKHWNLEL